MNTRNSEEGFICNLCGKSVPPTEGLNDDMPDSCDTCWEKAHADDDTNGGDDE
jgi:hypothetical protein